MLKQYEIHEEGTRFALIEAHCAKEALIAAKARFRRRSCDYNDYIGPMTWTAFGPDNECDSLIVEVE